MLLMSPTFLASMAIRKQGPEMRCSSVLPVWSRGAVTSQTNMMEILELLNVVGEDAAVEH